MQQILLVVPICLNQIEGRQQFVVSMHDFRVYLNINKKTTRVSLHDEIHMQIACQLGCWTILLNNMSL